MAFRKQKDDNKLDETLDIEDEISIDDSSEDYDEPQIKPKRGTKKRFNKPSNFILGMLDKIDANILLSIILAPISLIYNFLFAISSTYSLKQVYKVVLFNNIISFVVALIVHKPHLCFSVAVGSVAFLAFNYFVNDSIEHADAVSDTLVSFRRLSVNELMLGLRNILPFMKVKDDEEKEIIKQLDDGSYEGDVDDEVKSLDEEVLDELIPSRSSRQKVSESKSNTVKPNMSKPPRRNEEDTDGREKLSPKTSSLQKSLNEMNVDDEVLDTPSQDDIIRQMDKIPSTPVSTGIEIGGTLPSNTNQALPQPPVPNIPMQNQGIRSSSMPMQPLSPGVTGIPQQPNIIQQPPLSAGKPQGIQIPGNNGQPPRQVQQTYATPDREIDKLKDFKSVRSPAQRDRMSLRPTNNTSNTGGVMSADDSRDGLSSDYRM